jgi:YfiH family protein
MIILNQSSLRTKEGLAYFEIPELAEIGWLKHAFLTRQGGVSTPPYDSLNWSSNNGDLEEHVIQNRNRTASVFGVNPERFLLLRQIHQDGILLLKGMIEKVPPPLEYDAVIIDSPNAFVGIQTADCLPVLIVDRSKRVLAAVHAGRQGTALHIVNKVLRKMVEAFGSFPGDLLIGLGPSIRSCCYEIDEQVFHPEWKPHSITERAGKWWIDLAKITIDALKTEGIREDQISCVDLCTCCHPELLYSYRRDGRTGRQLSFIGITQF